ncbi:MAG: sodium:proton antiporter [Verrucomicrobiota bacterium]
MSFSAWIALTGGLLLVMALSSAYFRRLPVTSSLIYLGLGMAVGPLWLDLIAVDFIREKVNFEHLTEIAVIISLFVCGLKLRLPLTHPAWVASFWLAGPVMLASIAGVAVFSHWFLGFAWPLAFLLGAVLAPTDPVLAGAVTVNDAGDQDRMRYGLSGEAGFNDGAAFPFVIFALMWMEQPAVEQWAAGWALHRLVWAVPAGLLTGFLLGKWVGHFAIRLRSRNPDTHAPNDFLALALIALAYASAEAIGAWGFLAVFAAGQGFRRTEVKTTETHPAPEHLANLPPDTENPAPHPPAEEFATWAAGADDLKHPAKAAGQMVAEIISFGDTAERLLEMMMVVLVGICLSTYWDWRAVPLAFVLFVGIRPAFTLLFLAKTKTRSSQRWLMGWFGIRGIGSLYYLSYALNHGLDERPAEIAALTLSVVALSVAVHGLTSPLLDFYEKAVVRHKVRKASRRPTA